MRLGILFLLFFIFCFIHQVYTKSLIVIMLNGLSEELLESMPKLKKLRQTGVSGNVRSILPVQSDAVNHSVATGLLPASHGVVANYLYDNFHRVLHNKNERFYKYRESVVPIWSTDHIKSFCIDWNGSQFNYNNQICRRPLRVR